MPIDHEVKRVWPGLLCNDRWHSRCIYTGVDLCSTLGDDERGRARGGCGRGSPPTAIRVRGITGYYPRKFYMPIKRCILGNICAVYRMGPFCCVEYSDVEAFLNQLSY